MDAETIPAYLQPMLREQTATRPVNVYNFAAGAHFCTRRVTYFQNLLRSGFVPDFAVFIDGLNDFVFGMAKVRFRRSTATKFTTSLRSI